MNIVLREIKKRITSEDDIENYLCRQIKILGGTAYKFTSPSKRAVPDRLCVLPRGLVIFIEVKRPKSTPTQHQWKEINALRSKGHWTTYVDSYERVDEVVQQIKDKLETLPDIKEEVGFNV